VEEMPFNELLSEQAPNAKTNVRRRFVRSSPKEQGKSTSSAQEKRNEKLWMLFS
jgi:hypothetical protein